jgi:exopolysaccharide biosynthesis WecB/TagA/CpsF family protein
VSTSSTSIAYPSHQAGDRPLAAVAQPARPEPVRILGVPFAPLTADECIALVGAMLGDTPTHHIVIANAHTLNLAHEDPAYLTVLQNASLVLRDGVGVEIASRLLGRQLEYNFVGTDFVPHLLRAIGTSRVRVFLVGARPSVAVAAGDALARLAPGIEIAGVADGYAELHDAVTRVRASRADVLLVALGNPLQERWIAEHLARLDVRVAIGVGALFDFLAGRVPRAPEWMRTLRCEWLYRLYREPGRLWRRYLIGNAQFLWRVAKSRRTGRA